MKEDGGEKETVVEDEGEDRRDLREKKKVEKGEDDGGGE